MIKKMFFLLLFFSKQNALMAKNQTILQGPNEDSTLKERFIRSLLEDKNMESTWILTRVDSSYLLPNNFELISLKTFYQSFSESFISYDRKLFVQGVFRSLVESETFERYSNRKTLLKGIKIKSENYKPLAKKNIGAILNKYFDKNCRLKKKYRYMQNELIAACYVHNIKVVTPFNQTPYYEIFE